MIKMYDHKIKTMQGKLLNNKKVIFYGFIIPAIKCRTYMENFYDTVLM